MKLSKKYLYELISYIKRDLKAAKDKLADYENAKVLKPIEPTIYTPPDQAFFERYDLPILETTFLYNGYLYKVDWVNRNEMSFKLSKVE